MELRCLPTRPGPDGQRMIVDDEGRDPIEQLEAGRQNRSASNRSVDDDNRGELECILSRSTFNHCFSLVAVCASDGHTYPSTCHMIAESRTQTIPHVVRPGQCTGPPDEHRMVRPLTCQPHPIS